MGYAVYEQTVAGVTRWAGYGVPAECDWPTCDVEIDRGLGYQCEDHGSFDSDDEYVEREGCELTFCGEHRHDTEQHAGITPKAESSEWLEHVLTDDSWAQWRAENPDQAARYTEAVKSDG